jgi:hypothetical protein
MLKVGECFVILRKHVDGNFTVLNTFFPSNIMKEDTLLKHARHRLQQWYDTYFRDEDAYLVIAVAGPSMREGILGKFEIIH